MKGTGARTRGFRRESATLRGQPLAVLQVYRWDRGAGGKT